MIDITTENGIATLTWDMPGRSMNVLNEASLTAFAAAVEQALADPAVEGIVVTSGKDAFVAGADLETVKAMCEQERSAEEHYATAGALSDILRRLETGGKPVVAAINGTALGGGYEICLACHHRICADNDAIQLGLPEAKLGLLPGGGGTQRLPRMIGIQNAMQPLLEGKQFRPQKALKLGLIDQLVPAEELLHAANTWLKESPRSTQPWDERGFTIPGGGPEAPGVMQVFMGANAMTAANSYGNYPASKAILSCLYEGLRLPIDRGLAVEKRYFVSLLLDPTARNMIRTLFLNLQEANKGARRPEGFEPFTLTKIGILGAGLMGAGIAFVAAKAGLDVVLIDLHQEGADKGKAYTTKRMDKAISRKRATEADKTQVLSHITPTTDYALLEGCDLVVEAVFEDRAIKASVTRKAEEVIPPTAVFGSNTSTLPITGLAEASSRPAQFIGLHFFSPVERMPLVEVIRGERTSDEALAKSMDFIRAIHKTPIVVNDSRGFYTSRVFGTYITEGASMLLEGVAPALIENAGKMSGMPMPPLALADAVGLDLMHKVGAQTREDLGDAFVENPSSAVLKLLVVDHGRHGQKNGQGYYDYHEGGSKSLWSGLSEAFPPS
ncbi:MAG: 3-hydroxyacyl-CoA dehydrogenase NAD-binding domain-containing protein, partial [Myxococcota bacterium]